ncbi:MAG: hypothetical protein V1681_05175 [Candidatus Neomarinimicrobiota bacterium]
MSDTRLRIRLTSGSLIKLAGIISYSVILAANAFMIGSGIQSSFCVRKQERISSNLQTTAEIASAVAVLYRLKYVTYAILWKNAEVYYLRVKICGEGQN